jgi:hypothetical protein
MCDLQSQPRKKPCAQFKGGCAGLQVTKGEIIQPRQDTLKMRYRLFKDSCLLHKKFLSIDIFHINSDIYQLDLTITCRRWANRIASSVTAHTAYVTGQAQSLRIMSR